MIRVFARTAMLGMVLLATGMAPGDMTAQAASCLSSRDARNAVQSGKAISLSKMIGRIRSATGGEIVPPPKLCDQGGRLVYVVNVLSSDGQVTKVTVDAASGSIIGR